VYARILLACQPAESTTYWNPGYQAVNASTGHKDKGRSRQSGANRISKQILPALLVVGSGFVAGSAAAFELGDIKVDSKLGQPLRASITYALNPNEQLFDYCIFLRPGVMASGIPSVSKARISISGGSIVLTGNTPIREPALGMRITVNCPYTAQLSREYTLMVDPGLPVGGQQMVAAADPAPQTTSAATVAAPQVVAQVPAAEPTPTQTRAQLPATASPATVSPAKAAVAEQVDQSPISTNSQYFVQPGDSLYGIATRIENRQVALRPAANAIFSANPGAFTENDVNRLTAGLWITIPGFLGAGIVADTIAETNVAPVVNEYADDFADEYAADDAATEESTESTYTEFIADDVPEEIADLWEVSYNSTGAVK